PTGSEPPKTKGSRFLAEAVPVADAEAALAHLASVRAREHAATHHCWAYRLGPDAPAPRFSDDGEPSGSAGAPILREIEGREFDKIKTRILQQLTNFGQPFIYVIDANYLNRGELLLGHSHSGVDLKMDYARDTLRNLERVWRRPVSIVTQLDDKPKRIRFDGSETSMTDEVAAFAHSG
ncbi:MAG: YigZ family protein, partial [Nannocystaceae bacterium]